MKNSAAEKVIDSMFIPARDLEQYYCVEIPIPRLNIVYQFKIWEINFMSMSILIKEDSDILNWIKTRDKLKMRYYSYDPIYPYQDLYTEFTSIERLEHGRLRGHYLASFEIPVEQKNDITFWSHRLNYSNIIAFKPYERNNINLFHG